MSRYYGSMDSSRRRTEATCMMPHYGHVRGWNAGVKVIPDTTTQRDELAVYMTGGSSGSSPTRLLGTVTDTPDGPRWEPADPPKPPRIPVNVKTAGHPQERYAMPVIAALPVATHTNSPEPDEYVCVVLTGRWPSGEPVFGTVRATRDGDDWVTESRAYDMGVLGSNPGPWSLTRATTEMVEMTGHSRPPCSRPHTDR